MKGVSAVIATILMLMITIALAGMAYMYISGVFTSKTQTIEVIDAYCIGGIASFTIRNSGTADMGAGVITISSRSETCTGANPSVPAITAGTSVTIGITGCTVGRIHSWRAVGPSNAVELSVYCT